MIKRIVSLVLVLVFLAMIPAQAEAAILWGVPFVGLGMKYAIYAVLALAGVAAYYAGVCYVYYWMEEGQEGPLGEPMSGYSH